ncbi:MAG: 23S rRNA (adenine(2503)-C(2))-methyltransferase RlmN, partial [Aquificaceae bacterium]
MELITFYNLQELREQLKGVGLEPYRANQVMNWIYQKFETDFHKMTNLSKAHRDILSKSFRVHTLELAHKVSASDSIKYLFRTEDGHFIETVLIFERDHLTLCLSSQIGCAIN